MLGVTGSWSDRVCWFLAQPFQPCVPLFGRKDVSLPPGTGRVFAHGDLFTAFRGNRKRAEMLFGRAVSKVSLILSNHCATVECFGVSCPAPHQEHRLPGTSPSSYRELTQGLERGCQPACPVASGPFLASPALYLLGRCLSRMLLSGEELGSLSSHPFPPHTQRP